MNKEIIRVMILILFILGFIFQPAITYFLKYYTCGDNQIECINIGDE